MKTLFSTSINKAAWLVRKAAAKDLGVGVKEISWKICLDMAKKGEKYTEQNKYHPKKSCKKDSFFLKEMIKYNPYKRGRDNDCKKVGTWALFSYFNKEGSERRMEIWDLTFTSKEEMLNQAKPCIELRSFQ